VGNEERCAADASVVFTLAVILRLDGHVIGFAFDDDERGVVVGLVLGGAPEDKVGASGSGASASQAHLLCDLIESESVLVDKHQQVFLAYRLFGRFHQPFAAHVAPDFPLLLVAFDFQCAHTFEPPLLVTCAFIHRSTLTAQTATDHCYIDAQTRRRPLMRSQSSCRAI